MNYLKWVQGYGIYFKQKYLGFSGGLETTEDALDLIKGFPTGSFCLALLANVVPATPGDLDL